MTISPDDAVLQRALDQGLLSAAQLGTERTECNRHAGAVPSATELLAHLVSRGRLTVWDVARLRAEMFGLRTVEFAGLERSPAALATVPRKWAERCGAVPLALNDGVLEVAIGDPLELEGADELARLTGLAIVTKIAPAHEIPEAIARWYDATPAEAEPHPETAGSPAGEDATVIALVESIIRDAIDRRASDIHLEPQPQRFRVRHRIDGVLVDAGGPPNELKAAIVSRIKLLANLSIAEKRVPQDGRMQLAHRGRALDLRVSSLPTAHGESVVLRVLDSSGLRVGLGHLGFSNEDGARVERLITSPDGMVLVTGPTGSGKTTTLYGCLQHLNQADRKIITVEDPVEYQLSGINQVTVREGIGLTFGAALRAMLRQAPNVIMVGEIRDRETAEIAVNASLTGHRVFSTLHTNDATGAVARLTDIGVKPFLLASSLRGVLAQRLVRKLCPVCSRPHEPSRTELTALGCSADGWGLARFRRAVGCPDCGGTGYRGRIALFEIFVINEELQQMIHEKAPPARLRAKARALGMATLREDGARKVSAGLTTMEEVVSITVGDAG